MKVRSAQMMTGLALNLRRICIRRWDSSKAHQRSLCFLLSSAYLPFADLHEYVLNVELLLLKGFYGDTFLDYRR